ncbi:hypothetical protein RHGRI_017376 [Rhododendron griersonianum]|uniref:Uncharacterized protein n=1 Tax=Rhododendron griersonianum TaxID=479676 RepID=A0AAV6JXT4_9ERIC|nr:hypothetical protein RHGRI_017376 [Rhododendron griersonianum]
MEDAQVQGEDANPLGECGVVAPRHSFSGTTPLYSAGYLQQGVRRLAASRPSDEQVSKQERESVLEVRRVAYLS